LHLSDVCQVLKAIIAVLPQQAVTTIDVDFEAVMWTAVQRVMPNVHLRGCFFHYAQAVWRKI